MLCLCRGQVIRIHRRCAVHQRYCYYSAFRPAMSARCVRPFLLDMNAGCFFFVFKSNIIRAGQLNCVQLSVLISNLHLYSLCGIVILDSVISVLVIFVCFFRNIFLYSIGKCFLGLATHISLAIYNRCKCDATICFDRTSSNLLVSFILDCECKLALGQRSAFIALLTVQRDRSIISMILIDISLCSYLISDNRTCSFVNFAISQFIILCPDSILYLMNGIPISYRNTGNNDMTIRTQLYSCFPLLELNSILSFNSRNNKSAVVRSISDRLAIRFG